MALALQPHHRPARMRAPWVRRQSTEPTGLLAGLMLVLLLFGVATMLLVSQAARTPVARAAAPAPLQLLQSKTSVKAATSVEVAQAAPSAETTTEAAALPEAQPASDAAPPAASETVTPQPSVPAPAGLVAGAQARVANTEGLGVVLHDAPRKDARRPSGLLEGATVTVLGVVGDEWVQVRAAGRPDGWVPAAYLTPSE
jgi:hypothetical protein